MCYQAGDSNTCVCICCIWFYSLLRCQCLPHQLRNILRKKYFTKSRYYCKHIAKKIKCQLIVKFSEFYTTETVDSLIHLYEHGNHHNRVDDDVLAVRKVNTDEDLVTLYLRYYDWNSSQRSYVLDLWIVHFLYSFYIFYGLCCMWYSFCIAILFG